MKFVPILCASAILVACLGGCASPSLPPRVVHGGSTPQQAATTSERGTIDELVRRYLSALASRDASAAASLHEPPFDLARSRSSAFGRFDSVVSTVAVRSVSGETVVGGGHYGYKPPGWLATATVVFADGGASRSFDIGLGGVLGSSHGVMGAEADPGAR